MRIPPAAAFARQIRVSPLAIVPAGCIGTAARAGTEVHRPATFCICIVVLLLGVALSVSAQTPPDVGALDAVLRQGTDGLGGPGHGRSHRQGRTHRHREGIRRTERGEPGHVDERTLFAIASNTKAFTAAAVAALVDQQKVGWDEPVRQ